MCRGKVKNGQGLRNELEPFWAWKCGAPERAWAVLSVKMHGSGTSLIRFEWKSESPERPLTRGAAEREPAVGGDERVEIKEILKMMVSGTAKSAKKCKMVMLRNGFFFFVGNLWKWYAPERKFRAENGGLSRGTYPICIHMEVPPPPPLPGERISKTLELPSMRGPQAGPWTSIGRKALYVLDARTCHHLLRPRPLIILVPPLVYSVVAALLGIHSKK